MCGHPSFLFNTKPNVIHSIPVTPHLLPFIHHLCSSTYLSNHLSPPSLSSSILLPLLSSTPPSHTYLPPSCLIKSFIPFFYHHSFLIYHLLEASSSFFLYSSSPILRFDFINILLSLTPLFSLLHPSLTLYSASIKTPGLNTLSTAKPFMKQKCNLCPQI